MLTAFFLLFQLKTRAKKTPGVSKKTSGASKESNGVTDAV